MLRDSPRISINYSEFDLQEYNIANSAEIFRQKVLQKFPIRNSTKKFRQKTVIYLISNSDSCSVSLGYSVPEYLCTVVPRIADVR